MNSTKTEVGLRYNDNTVCEGGRDGFYLGTGSCFFEWMKVEKNKRRADWPEVIACTKIQKLEAQLSVWRI